MRSGLLKVCQHSPNHLLKLRNVSMNDRPHRGEIDSQVIVNNDVPKSPYFAPWNFGMFLLHLIRQAPCRFRECLQIAQNRVLKRV